MRPLTEKKNTHVVSHCYGEYGGVEEKIHTNWRRLSLAATRRQQTVTDITLAMDHDAMIMVTTDDG